ncbi:MAG: hypothetical protein DYG89_30425 [Caldilinea sp. CFX5]|nr:hypothetical protein [Caldilinea sp. CFX5]
MYTAVTMTTQATEQSIQAVLNMMEQAQRRNTQPQVSPNGVHVNGAKPTVYSVEAVLQMMELAQQRYRQ